MSGFTNDLVARVTAGTITQAQSDAITTAITTAEKTQGGVKTALDSLSSERVGSFLYLYVVLYWYYNIVAMCDCLGEAVKSIL